MHEPTFLLFHKYNERGEKERRKEKKDSLRTYEKMHDAKRIVMLIRSTQRQFRVQTWVGYHRS